MLGLLDEFSREALEFREERRPSSDIALKPDGPKRTAERSSRGQTSSGFDQ
jgi:hypothetical protein